MSETDDLLSRLLERRDRERAALARSMLSVPLEEAVLEENAQGGMRWYLHPDVPGPCIRSMLVYRYEIPPHSATGRQLVQGNIASFVAAGFGRTEVSGVEHPWQAGDVIAIPPLRDGSTVQHFNDSDEEALLITAEPNLLDAFGVDMGSGFEQLEPHPPEGY